MRKIVLSTAAFAGILALSACGESPASQEAAAPAAETAPEPAAAVAFADLTGDAAAGKTVFMQCRACHMIEEGKNTVGPTLYGVVGRAAGSVEGFANYSDANKNFGTIWTPEALFEYLESPRDYMPGTQMAFPGLKDAQDRADLIAYLETNGA